MAITYKSSGVSLEAADEALARIKSLVASTRTGGVLGDVGLFAGAFKLPEGQKKHPVLLSSTDGVGTKLKIAQMAGKYDTIGEDLVNHCVNDLLANGGDPLFFMDYFACGKLDPAMLEGVVRGLSRACIANGIALLGGETAEMPGLYRKGDFDLAGTIIGWAEEEELILGRDIQPGDVILGLPATGLHTNGYSLARKVLLDHAKLKLNQHVPELGCALGEELLKIHPSYLATIRDLRKLIKIKGIAHITGGGIEGNLIRVLPEGCKLSIDYGSWPRPPIFDLIQKLGPVDEEEMRRVFNLGVGLAVVTAKDSEYAVNKQLKGIKPIRIGEILKA